MEGNDYPKYHEMAKLHYEQGDLIAAAKETEKDIAHQCNCFCTMGAGIAPLIASAFPDALTADQATEAGNPYKLGTYSKGLDKTHGVTVYNLYGQFHWRKFQLDKGRNTDYDALNSAIKLMSDDLVTRGKKRIALPKIGCGLAGGDWRVVESMLKTHLCSRGIEVVVYYL